MLTLTRIMYIHICICIYLCISIHAPPLTPTPPSPFLHTTQVKGWTCCVGHPKEATCSWAARAALASASTRAWTGAIVHGIQRGAFLASSTTTTIMMITIMIVLMITMAMVQVLAIRATGAVVIIIILMIIKIIIKIIKIIIVVVVVISVMPAGTNTGMSY
jgi:hypothetical protein